MVRTRAFALFLTLHIFLSYDYQDSLRIKELPFDLNVLLLIKNLPAKTESTLRESKQIRKCEIDKIISFSILRINKRQKMHREQTVQVRNI